MLVCAHTQRLRSTVAQKIVWKIILKNDSSGDGDQTQDLASNSS